MLRTIPGLLFVLLACTCLTRAAAAEGNDQARDRDLVAVALLDADLGERALDSGDIDRLGKWMRSGDPRLVSRARTVLAGVLRLQQEHPLGALVLLSDVLGDPADPVWRRFRALAVPIRPPYGDGDKAAPAVAALPGPATWLGGEAGVVAAIEAARCLRALGSYDAAVVATRAGVTHPEPGIRMRALEATGDLLVVRHVDLALDAYEAARAALAGTLVTSSSGDQRAPTPVEAAWLARLDRRIRATRESRDQARYGEAFVVYRASETARQGGERWEDAIAGYRRLATLSPETVFAAAAGAYEIRCLLALADPAAEQALRRRCDAAQVEVKVMREHHLRCAATSGSFMARASAEALDAAQRRLAAMRALPTGAAAATAAQILAKAILATPDHLYQGEVMLDLADWQLDQRADPAAALAWYRKADDWLVAAAATPPTVMPIIPPQARTVSAPRPARRAFDVFGTSALVVNAPGAVVNQITADWYLGALLERCLLRRGLAEFVAGKRDVAVATWTRLYDIDPFYRERERRGFGSVVERLRYDAVHQNGGLYAKDDEMAAFTDQRRRLRVLSADLAFEAGDHAAASIKYRELLAETHGSLNPDERGYCVFALAVCCAYLGHTDEVNTLLARFDDELAGTPSRPRALFFRAKTLLSPLRPAVAAEERAFADCALLLERHPRTEEADAALYMVSWFLARTGRHDAARASYRRYLTSYPDGGFADAARSELADLPAVPAKGSKP